MSEYRNHIKQYTASDIQRYLDGQMNAAEMHAMEKAALDDPFLADAIEGYESRKEYDNETINRDLVQLRNQISEKASTGKVIPHTTFQWRRLVAAAVVVLIFGTVAYTYWSKSEKSKQLIVVNEQKPAASEPNTAQAEKVITPESDTFNKNITRSSEQVKESSIEAEKKSARQIDIPANRDFASAPPVAEKDNNDKISNLSKADDVKGSAIIKQENSQRIKDSINTDSALAGNKKIIEYEPQRKTTVTDEELVIVNPDKKAKDKPVVTGYGTVKRSATTGNNALNYFNGRVTDNSNRPIANATVQLANTRNGYITDQYGNFRIPSPDSSVNVTISGVGFDVQTIQLRNDLAINHIQLQPSPVSLSEVVITKPSPNAKRERSNYKTKYPSVLIQDAEPANGWIEFDKYIESNKRINPDDPNFRTGEVVVSFQVNRKSELSDFKIEQRLSVAQDAEAIRLIKEGPSWRLLKGKKARIMVIIRF